MSDEMFVRCCAPTLAGIKTGSMFSCEYADREEMTDELRRLNRVLAPGDMCLLPLRFHDGKALLCVSAGSFAGSGRGRSFPMRSGSS